MLQVIQTTFMFGSMLYSTLLRQRLLSYRNHSNDLLYKSMDWFLYDNGLHHERVKKIKKNYSQFSGNVLVTIFLLIFNASFEFCGHVGKCCKNRIIWTFPSCTNAIQKINSYNGRSRKFQWNGSRNWNLRSLDCQNLILLCFKFCMVVAKYF